MGSAPISRRDTDSRGGSSHAYGFQLCGLNDKQAPSLRNSGDTGHRMRLRSLSDEAESRRPHPCPFNRAPPPTELVDNRRRPGVNGSPQNVVPGRKDEVWRLLKGGRAFLLIRTEHGKETER